MPILGAVERKLEMGCKTMQNDKISIYFAWNLTTACTLSTFVGKESHFKISAYASVKPRNYETSPTEQLDGPSHCFKNSQKPHQHVAVPFMEHFCCPFHSFGKKKTWRMYMCKLNVMTSCWTSELNIWNGPRW